MGRKLIDIKGQRFGRLVVVEYKERGEHGSLWLCQCDCGNQKIVYGHLMRRGNVVSCGCQHREKASQNIRRFIAQNPHPCLKHGESLSGGTPELHAWNAVKKTCEGWANFEAFLADVGRRPSDKHFLCRRDITKPCGPSNFIWATAKERARNRKSSLIIECNGERLSLAVWAERSGVKYETILGRIKSGWPAHEAIFTKASISKSLKKTWDEGRIRSRQPIYSKEEIKARTLQRSRQKYASNKNAILARHQEWHAKNPGRKKEISAKYTDKNRYRLNASQREKNKLQERKEFMRSYAKKHREDNPHLYRTYTHNRRARKIGADGTHTKQEWLEKLEINNGCCVYCGINKNISRDHDIPLSRGGSNDISNILPACRRCNFAKGTMTADEFRVRLESDGRIWLWRAA